MRLYALLHYDEIVGIYSSRDRAEVAKTIGHVKCLEPQGWFIEEWELDHVAHVAEANRGGPGEPPLDLSS